MDFSNAEDWFSTPYFGDKERNIHAEDIYVGYRYFETFAKDKVQYPFGYGLGYTDFTMQTVGAHNDSNETPRSIVRELGKVYGGGCRLF